MRTRGEVLTQSLSLVPVFVPLTLSQTLSFAPRSSEASDDGAQSACLLWSRSFADCFIWALVASSLAIAHASSSPCCTSYGRRGFARGLALCRSR